MIVLACFGIEAQSEPGTTACPSSDTLEETRKTSIEHFRHGEFAQAETLERCMLEVVSRSGDRKAEAQSLNNLGVLARRRGDIDTALDLYRRALDIRREIGDLKGTAQSLNNLAIIEKNRGNLYQALSLHLEALPIRRQSSSPNAIAESLDNISLIYKALGDYKEAERYSRESIQLAESEESHPGLARQLGNLASILLFQQRREEAEEAALRALSLARESGARPSEAHALMMLSDIHRERDQLSEAQDFATEAEQLVSQLEDPSMLRDVRMMRAELLLARGLADQALVAAQAGLTEAREQKVPLIERDWLRILAEAHERSGDFEQALDYRKQFQQLDRELSNALTTRQMADLRASMDLQQQQSELELLERDNRIQSLQIDRQRALGILMVGGILILGLAVLLFAMRYRYSRHANRMLRSKSEALEQASRTDFLTGLPNRLALADYCEQRNQDDLPMTAVLVDIDHFKRINDRYGHAAGDQALVTVARTLRETAPDSLVGRWGGEEFLILDDTAPTSDLKRRLSRLLEAVHAIPLRFDGETVGLTISLGCAIREIGESLPHLLARADAALYEAKNAGRDRMHIARAQSRPT